jgi:hypothetical protein
MKFHTVQFSPIYYLIPLQPKNSPQHPQTSSVYIHLLGRVLRGCVLIGHVFVRMGKKCTPTSGIYTLPRRTRPYCQRPTVHKREGAIQSNRCVRITCATLFLLAAFPLPISQRTEFLRPLLVYVLQLTLGTKYMKCTNYRTVVFICLHFVSLTPITDLDTIQCCRSRVNALV